MNFLRRLALQEKTLDDSSRLDVEIARVPDTLPSFFPVVVGLWTYQHPTSHVVGICTVRDKGLYTVRCASLALVPLVPCGSHSPVLCSEDADHAIRGTTDSSYRSAIVACFERYLP